MNSGSTKVSLHGSAGLRPTTSTQSGKSGVSSWFVKCPEVSLPPSLTRTQTEGYQSALSLDSMRASHPIEVPVRNALEVDQIFDHISYLKGSSVIRMLSNHLGQEIFLKGVGDYLKLHAYVSRCLDAC